MKIYVSKNTLWWKSGFCYALQHFQYHLTLIQPKNRLEKGCDKIRIPKEKVLCIALLSIIETVIDDINTDRVGKVELFMSFEWNFSKEICILEDFRGIRGGIRNTQKLIMNHQNESFHQKFFWYDKDPFR